MNIIISLKKNYFDLIISGKQKYEFRRKFINQSCGAFIYVPRPICEIQGYIEFGGPIIDSPKELNKLALSQGILEDNDILEYMYDLKKGYALPVKKAIRFKTFLSLDYLKRTYNFFAPQSYIIVDKRPELFKELLLKLKESNFQYKNPNKTLFNIKS